MAEVAVPHRRAARSPRSELEVTTAVPRDVWRELLAQDSDALVSQSPEWLDTVCAVDGCEDASRLYETPWGTRLVLPMVRRSAGPLGRFAPQGPPAWGMCDLIAESRPTARDVEAVLGHLVSEPSVRTTIRPNPLHGHLWATARNYGAIEIPRLAHVVSLQGGADGAWSRLRSQARAGVRRAERQGVEVTCDKSGRLIPVFYDLLDVSVKRWARQQHEPLALARWRARRRDPVTKFVALAEALGDAMRVWVARHEGRPVAAIMVLQDANASYTRGAMIKDMAGPTKANDLLHWLAIKDACEAGCRYYHMGESGTSSSLARFKQKFGAEPVPYAEYRIERLPLTRADSIARGAVKRVVGFRDA